MPSYLSFWKAMGGENRAADILLPGQMLRLFVDDQNPKQILRANLS
jgi:hypothetical protein